MRIPDDCRRFEEGLERSLAGAIDSDTEAMLETHAGSCPDCASLAELRRTLAARRPADDCEVPDGILDGYWPDLRKAILERRGARQRRRFLPGLLAAAVILSLLLNLVLLSTLSERGRQEDRLLELLAERGEPVRGIDPETRGDRSGGLIARQAGVTLGDLAAALESLPDRMVILRADQAEYLALHLEAADAIVDRRAFGALLADGLEAEELRRWLVRHPIDPEIHLSPKDLAVLRETEIRRSF